MKHGITCLFFFPIGLQPGKQESYMFFSCFIGIFFRSIYEEFEEDET